MYKFSCAILIPPRHKHFKSRESRCLDVKCLCFVVSPIRDMYHSRLQGCVRHVMIHMELN